MSGIPHAEVVDDPRKESSFRQAKQESRAQQSTKIVYETHADSYYTPGYHQCRKPNRWCESLQDDIRRDFEKDIAKEVDRQCPQVRVIRDVKIRGQTFELGITDIASVQEGKQVKKSRYGQDIPIDLAEQSTFFLRRVEY